LAGLEYDGKWNMQHYIIKDIFNNIIATPQYNYATGDLVCTLRVGCWMR